MIMSDMERITFTLPVDMAKDVRAALESGDYASSSEIMRDALRGWRDSRLVRLHELSLLRRDIEQGMADVQAGRTTLFDKDRLKKKARIHAKQPKS